MELKEEYVVLPLLLAVSVAAAGAILCFGWPQVEFGKLARDFGGLAGGIIGALGAYSAAVFVFNSQKKHAVERIAVGFSYEIRLLRTTINLAKVELTLANTQIKIISVFDNFHRDQNSKFIDEEFKSKIHQFDYETFCFSRELIRDIQKFIYYHCKPFEINSEKEARIRKINFLKDANKFLDTIIFTLQIVEKRYNLPHPKIGKTQTGHLDDLSALD